jgi:hypothetical protein
VPAADDAGRAGIAAAQADLLRAVAGHADPPAGFDGTQIRSTSRALASKRSRAAARAWPALDAAIGPAGLARQFAAFAAAHPLPRDGGPLADGYAFAGFLRRARELPDEGPFGGAGVTLRYRRAPRACCRAAGACGPAPACSRVRVAWCWRCGTPASASAGSASRDAGQFGNGRSERPVAGSVVQGAAPARGSGRGVPPPEQDSSPCPPNSLPSTPCAAA